MLVFLEILILVCVYLYYIVIIILKYWPMFLNCFSSWTSVKPSESRLSCFFDNTIIHITKYVGFFRNINFSMCIYIYTH